MSVDSCYLKPAFQKENIDLIIKSFKNCLKDNVWGSFDGIVCRGLSGMLIAPILSYEFDKKLLVVRKNDGSHSWYKVEGCRDINKYIMVDDFICTGSTLEIITEEVRNNEIQKGVVVPSTFVGCYFWKCSSGVSQKEKMFINSETRYKELALNKVYAKYNHYATKNYEVDTFESSKE